MRNRHFKLIYNFLDVLGSTQNSSPALQFGIIIANIIFYVDFQNEGGNVTHLKKKYFFFENFFDDTIDTAWYT